ncbi:MAG: hypothetical protein K2L50_01815 [Bacteroidales bacterium]|nr:hypothetical protein [Bacteroidales bacterium]
MKPFWRYGKAGKERLIIQAFAAVQNSISWEDEDAAKLAVHQWLMDKGYFNGTNKQKSKKFKDPNFFWARKNYDKFVALLKALLNQKFYEESEAEARAYQSAMQQAKYAEIDAATEQFYQQWPEYDKRRNPGELADTWHEETASSFDSWLLWASAAYCVGMMIIGRKKK